MIAKVKVIMFGEFLIEYGDKIIGDQENRSKKVWLLLEYLIINRERMVTQKELIQYIWQNNSTVDSANTLKVLVFRVRKMLNKLDFPDTKNPITYDKGAYGWNKDYECDIDIDCFRQLLADAEVEKDDLDRKVVLLLQAISLYKAEFLKNNRVDGWVTLIRKEYAELYNKAVMEACKILYQGKRFQDIIGLMPQAISIQPYNEKFYMYYIKAFGKEGQIQKALEVYEYVSNLFLKELGVELSEKMRLYHKKIVSSDACLEMNLEMIQENLKENGKEQGCFYCEYEFFRSFYRLKSRNIDRTREIIYIGLVTVINNKDESMMSKRALDSVMDILKVMIRYELRKGDIFTKFSGNQYLVMLPTPSIESANLVLKRIIDLYKKDHPNTFAEIKYTAHLLE